MNLNQYSGKGERYNIYRNIMNQYFGKGQRYILYRNIMTLNQYSVKGQRSNVYHDIMNNDSDKTLAGLVNAMTNHNIHQSSGKTQTVLVNNITQYL
jgi:hypothetical protein